MQLTVPIRQLIGTNSGDKNDGVIIGEISHENFNSETYFSYSHEVSYAYQDNNNAPISPTNTWTPFTDALNEKTSAQPFLPLDVSNAYPTFYLAVRDGITGFSFNVVTAGIGTFSIAAYYNTEDDGYIPLPGAVFSTNFFKSTGIATVFFTPPADWAEDYIGNISIPPQRWLRLQITSGSISTQPQLQGGWEMSGTLQDSGISDSNPPFINPYRNLLPTDGDRVYLSSTNKPYGMILGYTNPLSEGNVEYLYSKSDASFGSLTIISDTSNGLTYSNSAPIYLNDLTTTNSNALTSTVEGVTSNAFIYGVVSSLPDTLDDIISIGFSETKTGTPDYQLAIFKPAGAAVYQVIEFGSVVATTTIEATFGDEISILRYDGKIYYQVNGVNILPLATPSETTAVLYGRVFATNTSLSPVNISIFIVDWSERLGTGLEITFTNAVFTPVVTTPNRELPGHYYIQFIPPEDFSSLTILQSPTGVAGYVLAVQSNFTTLPTSNITLLDEKVLTVDSNSNVYFPAGAQTIINNIVLDVQNEENFTSEQKFILHTKNSVNYESQLITFPATTGDSGILDQITEKVGMTELILIQVDGIEKLNIGIPSFVLFAS